MNDVLVVWLHGSQGWKQSWTEHRRDWHRETSAKNGAVSLFPVIDYGTRIEPAQAKDECEADYLCLQEQLAGSRAVLDKHGQTDLPTVYAGVSRGGFLAMYAAQRDPLAAYVLNIGGSLVNEADARYWPVPAASVPVWRQAALDVLQAAHDDGGFSGPLLSMYGAMDLFTPDEGHALAMHKTAGGDPALFHVVPGAGHYDGLGYQGRIGEAVTAARA